MSMQVLELAELLHDDVVQFGRITSNRGTIRLSIILRSGYRSEDWGWASITIPLESETGDWLRDNGFLPQEIR